MVKWSSLISHAIIFPILRNTGRDAALIDDGPNLRQDPAIDNKVNGGHYRQVFIYRFVYRTVCSVCMLRTIMT